MIFVTVGSMFLFDRADRRDGSMGGRPGPGPGRGEILAQIGAGSLEPPYALGPPARAREFARTVAGAEFVVAHAGMGSVITAGEYGKPIVLLPRRAAAGEHTNDHQIDTAGWLRRRPGIYVADAEQDLGACITEALARGAGARASAPPPRRIFRPAAPFRRGLEPALEPR